MNTLEEIHEAWPIGTKFIHHCLDRATPTTVSGYYWSTYPKDEWILVTGHLNFCDIENAERIST